MKRVGKKLGDTLIEVTIAIGIFSMVAVAVVSVVSASASSAQANLETTVAREEIDAQAEALRFIQDLYMSDNSSTLWKTIKNNAKEASANNITFNVNDCAADIYNTGLLKTQKAFIINTRKLRQGSDNEVIITYAKNASSFTPTKTYPRIVYSDAKNDDTLLGQDTGSKFSSAEGIYIVPVKNNKSTAVIEDAGSASGAEQESAYYDFYIRSCWYAPGSNFPTTISTVVRLYDPDIAASDNVTPIRQSYYHEITFDNNEQYYKNKGHNVKPTGSYSKKQQAYTGVTVNLWGVQYFSETYGFVGWNTKKDGTGTTYKDQAAYTAPSGLKTIVPVTLYAQWQKLAEATIEYYGNGGANSQGQTKVTQKIPVGRTRNVIENPYTKANYDFVAWNTQKNGSGDDYTSTYSVPADYDTKNPIKLYAKWKEKPHNTITFACGKFKDVAVTPKPTSPQIVYTGSPQYLYASSTVCNTPANAEFTGWTVSGCSALPASYGDKVEFSYNSACTGGITLTAGWKNKLLVVISNGNTSSTGSFDASTYKTLTLTGTAKISYNDCHSSTAGWATGKIQMVLKSGSSTHTETLISEDFQNNTGCWEDGSHCDGHWRSGSTSKTLNLVVDLPSNGIDADNTTVTFKEDHGGVFCTGGYDAYMSNIKVIVSGS